MISFSRFFYSLCVAGYSVVLLMCCGSAIAGEGGNLALGARYTIDPAPNYDLTKDAGDATQLTDGRYAHGHFWSTREAVGWRLSGPIHIEIDLGTTRTIDGVCINSARGNNADVAFPERVEIFVSLDKKQYKSFGDVYRGMSHADGAYFVKKFCASKLAAVGRYLLLVVQPRGRFTFLDEIEVLGGEGVRVSGRSPAYSIKREEINDLLNSRLVLLHRKLTLAQLAAKVLGNSDGGHNIKNQINSFTARLESESEVDSDSLDKYMDELLALNRFTIPRTLKEPLIVWYKDPWAAFSPIDRPTPEALIKNGLHFDLMRRGSVSNAFVMTNNSDQPQNYRIAMIWQSPKVSPQFEIREVVPVMAANHELIGDALKPLDYGSVSLKPGESKQIWLTMLGGKAATGDFDGRVIVTCLQGDCPATNIALHAKIWPATFPQQQKVFVNAWAYLNWSPIKKTPQSAVDDLSSHHVNVAALNPAQIPWPTGLGVTDFTKFDELLRYQEGTRKQLFYLGFNDENLRTFGGKYVFMSDAWQAIFKKWVKEWAAHLKVRGLAYQNFAFYPVDEPKNDDEARYLFEVARLIKQVDPQLEVYTTIGDLSTLDLIKARKYLDIFQVLVSDLKSVKVMTLKGMGKEIWTYTAEGGGKLASPLSFYRIQAWQAFQGGATGIGFWAYADAGLSGTAWDDFDGNRPDFSVIYEGGKFPISSKRWEAWREGVEDYELLTMARKKLKAGKEVDEFDTKIRDVINNPGGYRNFEIVRRYLLSVASK